MHMRKEKKSHKVHVLRTIFIVENEKDKIILNIYVIKIKKEVYLYINKLLIYKLTNISMT